MNKLSVLLVCHANICRSPMAEGILKHYLAEQSLQKVIKVDSAGTHAGFLSSRPDARAQRIAAGRGIDISKLKSRRIKAKDFERFSYILVMDTDNYENLLKVCPEELKHKLALVMDYGTEFDYQNVPDPYYGSETGFEQVFDLLEGALDGFMLHLLQIIAPTSSD